MTLVSEKRVPVGELVTEADAAGVSRDAATRIAAGIKAALKARGQASVALSGGNTPRDAYAMLAHEPGIDWSKVQIFWVDERAVGPTDDRSNYRWAKATLLDGASIPAASVHRMPSDAASLETAAQDYSKAIKAHVPADASGVPAFDVLVLGVGEDGHTASLFPGDPTVDVTDRLVAAVHAQPGREARLTLTRPVLQHARSVLVLCVGAAKRGPLGRAWASKGDLHETPSRLLLEAKGAVTWILDRAAAGTS
jgi:6-phosphogluconolactonase